MHHAIFVHIFIIADEFAGIDDNFDPAIIIIQVEIQNQNASLRCDHHMHFIGDDQPVRAAYLLGMKKQRDAFTQAL